MSPRNNRLDRREAPVIIWRPFRCASFLQLAREQTP